MSQFSSIPLTSDLSVRSQPPLPAAALIDLGSADQTGVRGKAFAGQLQRPAQSWYLWCKPAWETFLAAFLLIISAPVILVLAVAVRLGSPGPAFYHQPRVGKNGRRYTIYKLRTMAADAEHTSGPVWAQKSDPRITGVGRFLRASHLDELPQLANVVLGQMSLIGPRPERPEIVEYLRSKIENYEDRLTVRPGITGLAQLHLPPDVNLEGVSRKLVCDFHYITHASAGLDFRILICTGLLMLGVPTNLSRRLLRVPNPLQDEKSDTPGRD